MNVVAPTSHCMKEIESPSPLTRRPAQPNWGSPAAGVLPRCLAAPPCSSRCPGHPSKPRHHPSSPKPTNLSPYPNPKLDRRSYLAGSSSPSRLCCRCSSQPRCCCSGSISTSPPPWPAVSSLAPARPWLAFAVATVREVGPTQLERLPIIRAVRSLAKEGIRINT